MKARIIRVNELIKQEVAEIMLEDINFPAGTLVTVVAAKVSVDLRYADIIISVYPSGNREAALEALNENIYAMQQIINKKLSMKPVPKIRFRVDESAEYVEKIERLIRKSKEE
ncbi:MAG: 30S ribosome-binding factor RbfA [Candidatus Paceibacterota bacterium]|jgi:ribosome-binding factor A